MTSLTFICKFHINSNDGHDILIGGGHSEDILSGDDGNDFAAGDCVSIKFFADHHISSITSISEEAGDKDNITMGNGDDIAIGGLKEDELHGDDGTDILVGDHGRILFYPTVLNTTNDTLSPGYFWNIPMSIGTVSCEYGSDDEIYGGNGTDYIIAGALNDYVDSGSGMDLVFGDHGEILLSEEVPYKLIFATTTHPNCTPGSDNITLGEDHNIAFGGKPLLLSV